MFLDFRLASHRFAKDHVGPVGGPVDNVVCWQEGQTTSREDLHALVDQMWDAVEKRARDELQGSKQTAS